MIIQLIASVVLIFTLGECCADTVKNEAAAAPINWKEIEPDAIIWAKPYAGKPLKVLFLCWGNGTAEATAVAHRLPMDYRAFEVGQVWNYEAVMKKLENKERLLKLLREDYDACVMAGGISVEGLPSEIQYHLLNKVIGGMGLISFYTSRYPFPEAIMKKAKQAPLEEVIAGLPISLFSTLIEAPERTDAAVDEHGFYIPAGFSGRTNSFSRSNIAGASLDGSRIVWLPFGRDGYVTRPNFVYSGAYTKDMYIYDEYYISMLCKAILWAAHRTPNARIISVAPSGANLTLDKEVTATVTINAENKAGLSLCYQVRDYRYRTHLQNSMDVDLHKGTNSLQLRLPLSAGGNYILDVWLKDGDKVVDWGTGYFDLYGQGRITAIALGNADNLRRGQAVEGMVTVKNTAPGAKLKMSLIDSYYRIITARILDIKGDNVGFKLPLHAYIAGIMFDLRGEIVMDGKTQFVADYHFPVPKERPEYFMTVAMGEDNGAFHLARMRRQRLEPFRFDGDHYITSAFGATALAWDNREVNSEQSAIGTISGWTFPSLEKEYIERAHKTAKALKPFGQRYAVLGDDSAPAGQIAGLGDHKLRYHKAYLQKKYSTIADFNKEYGVALASWDDVNNEFTKKWVEQMFRQYLRGKYKDLAELNRSWGTSADAWETIDQKFVDERKKENNFAPEVELKRFGEINYYETYDKVKKAAQAENPGLALGHYASGIGQGLGEALEKINFLAPYWRDYLCEEMGAFYGKQPGYYGANGGYFDETGTPPGRWLQPWYPLLSGLNNVVFWYTVERIYGDLTLSPLKIKIWLDQANKIKTGIDKQVLGAVMHKDPVAILYSQASGFASEYDKKIAEAGNSRLSFNAIFHDLGLQYHYISGKHLLDGMLDKEKIKVLILPYCQALSQAEADTIRNFVKNGGTVVADLRPAIKTENCQPLEKGLLDDVFGIARTKTDDYVRFGRLSVVKPLPGLEAGEQLCDVSVDSSVKLASGQNHCAIDGSPAVIINQFGAGRAILLNFYIGRYVLLQAENHGGKLNTLFDDLMQTAGLGPQASRIQALAGGQKAVATRRVLFKNGTMDILGVCKRTTAFEKFPLTVDFVLPEAKHVYSMMDGRYFGKTGKYQDVFEPEQTKFYALLPYKVEKLELDVPGVVKKGEILQVNINIKTDGGAAAPHVELIQIKDKDGRFLKWFENKVTAGNGQAGLSLPVAINEQSGKYTLVLTDIPTGTITEKEFEIK